MQAIKRNARGWRWRLVLWLTGGVIEAAPMLPIYQPVRHDRTLVVRLGKAGALNTVEYKPYWWD